MDDNNFAEEKIQLLKVSTEQLISEVKLLLNTISGELDKAVQQSDMNAIIVIARVVKLMKKVINC